MGLRACHTGSMSSSAPATSEVLAMLSRHGLAASTQRVALLAHILSSHGAHPSADDLYRQLADQFPTLSRATVYNNLSALVAAGMVEKLDTPDGARYGPVTKPHVNLACSDCGTIEDVLIGDSQLDILIGRAAAAGVFLPRGVSITVTGRCKACHK